MIAEQQTLFKMSLKCERINKHITIKQTYNHKLLVCFTMHTMYLDSGIYRVNGVGRENIAMVSTEVTLKMKAIWRPLYCHIVNPALKIMNRQHSLTVVAVFRTAKKLCSAITITANTIPKCNNNSDCTGDQDYQNCQ